MAGHPRISVLMSCFNAQRWVADAVESVLAQTYHQFELILVDDGSTDLTPEILDAYRRRDERIRVVHKANTGLADSLNAGMAIARGEWIARLDADDLCEKARLASQISFLDNHPGVVLLGSGFVEIDENGHELASHVRPANHAKLVQNLERLQRFFPHSSAMFERSLSTDLGGYNTRFKKTQDWDLWLRLAENGVIACLPSPLVRIRTHPNQITNASSGRPQLVYGAAAAVSHFLRIEGHRDPSTRVPEEWTVFIQWVEAKMATERILERRAVWISARNAYFGASNRVLGILSFSLGILRSGSALQLIRDRLFAFAFPRRLATEWVLGGFNSDPMNRQ